MWVVVEATVTSENSRISARTPASAALGTLAPLLACVCLLAACARPAENAAAPGALQPFRLGCFPNLTHAQALLGRQSGAFEKALGVPVEWTFFNAGPSAVEALFTGAIDAAYLGPNPAINGHIKSSGQNFVIVAGAASGGAALVVRGDAAIRSDGDFHGRLVATPQLGNTQDVAARLWFQSRGYVTKDRGGDLTLIALSNPDQLLMFQRREIDAAWTIEPWVSRLEHEAGGRVYVDERDLWPGGRYPTAILVVRRAVLERSPAVVGRLLGAHVDLTLALMAGDRGEAEALSREIERITSAALPLPVVRSALTRLTFTWDPLIPALTKAADDAYRVGFLGDRPDLTGIADLGPLNAVLATRRQPAVEQSSGPSSSPGGRQ